MSKEHGLLVREAQRGECAALLLGSDDAEQPPHYSTTALPALQCLQPALTLSLRGRYYRMILSPRSEPRTIRLSATQQGVEAHLAVSQIFSTSMVASLSARERRRERLLARGGSAISELALDDTVSELGLNWYRKEP